MITVGHAFVPTGRVVRVRTARLWGTLHGIGGTNFDDMLINMILDAYDEDDHGGDNRCGPYGVLLYVHN